MLVRLAPFVRGEDLAVLVRSTSTGSPYQLKRHTALAPFSGRTNWPTHSRAPVADAAAKPSEATPAPPKPPEPNNGARPSQIWRPSFEAPSCHEKTGIESPLVSRNWQVGSTRVKFGITSCRSGDIPVPAPTKSEQVLELRFMGTDVATE